MTDINFPYRLVRRIRWLDSPSFFNRGKNKSVSERGKEGNGAEPREPYVLNLPRHASHKSEVISRTVVTRVSPKGLSTLAPSASNLVHITAMKTSFHCRCSSTFNVEQCTQNTCSCRCESFAESIKRGLFWWMEPRDSRPYIRYYTCTVQCTRSFLRLAPITLDALVGSCAASKKSPPRQTWVNERDNRPITLLRVTYHRLRFIPANRKKYFMRRKFVLLCK